jgi:hypothetical protein
MCWPSWNDNARPRLGRRNHTVHGPKTRGPNHPTAIAPTSSQTSLFWRVRWKVATDRSQRRRRCLREAAADHRFRNPRNLDSYARPGFKAAGAACAGGRARRGCRQCAVFPGESEPTRATQSGRRRRERSPHELRRIVGCAGASCRPAARGNAGSREYFQQLSRQLFPQPPRREPRNGVPRRGSE